MIDFVKQPCQACRGGFTIDITSQAQYGRFVNRSRCAGSLTQGCVECRKGYKKTLSHKFDVGEGFKKGLSIFTLTTSH
jgi:hypothetical protein